MRKLFTYLFLLILTISNAQENSEPVVIPFQLTPNGHIMIAASVNGIAGTFIFDTGAGMNLLTKKFADKVPDLEHTHHFSTGHRATGEELMTDLWNSKKLEIGDFKFDKNLFAVYDLEFPLDGLISLTPFLHRPITINFNKKQLIIESESSMKERVTNADFEMPIKIHSDKGITLSIATDVLVNDDLSLLVNLDSGAGFGMFRVSDRYMKNLGVEVSKVKTEIRTSVFVPDHTNTFYFESLNSFSDLQKNAEVNDVKVQFISGLIHEGIVGIDWIGKEITIDMDNRRLIVKK